MPRKVLDPQQISPGKPSAVGLSISLAAHIRIVSPLVLKSQGEEVVQRGVGASPNISSDEQTTPLVTDIAKVSRYIRAWGSMDQLQYKNSNVPPSVKVVKRTTIYAKQNISSG